MRLADLTVTHGLETNNRCLRYLSQCDGWALAVVPAASDMAAQPVTIPNENLLARDGRRLIALWDLAQPLLDESQLNAIAEHAGRLAATVRTLSDYGSARSAAGRLAALAVSSAASEAIAKLAAMHTEPPAELDSEALHQLFTRDSEFWRAVQTETPEESDGLLVKRIARSYRKSYRLTQRYLSAAPQAQKQWLEDHTAAWFGCTQRCVHQMELLRPVLSDKHKKQLWHLDKLAQTQRALLGLMAAEDALANEWSANGTLGAATLQTVSDFIEMQRHKLLLRMDKLLLPGFAGKPKKLRERLAKAAAELAELETGYKLTVPFTGGTEQGDAQNEAEAVPAVGER